MKKRSKQEYNKEFKQRAIKMAVTSNKTIAQIARELGVNATTLCSGLIAPDTLIRDNNSQR